MQPPDHASREKPTGCDKEIARIRESNSKRQVRESSWAPDSIAGDCCLHHFIDERHWPEGEAKPYGAALKDQGMSVIISDHGFPSVTKPDLKMAINATKRAGLVGAVYFTAKSVRDLGYTVLHDPNDFYNEKTETWEPQASNHAEIICKKNKASKQDALREICMPSLTPAEFDSIELNKTIEQDSSTDSSSGPDTKECDNHKRTPWLVAVAIIFALSALVACLRIVSEYFSTTE